MRTKSFLLFSILYITSGLGHADEVNPGIRLGAPAYAGSGCPLGSVGLALSPDSRALSIQFDSFEAKSALGGSNRYVRKFCDLVIPVHVPSGFSVLPVKGRFIGVYKIAENASARVQVIRAWSGVENSRQKIDLEGPSQNTFDLEVAAHTEMWSPCGVDVSLRYSFLLQLDIRDLTKESSVRLDALEPSPEENSFQWRKCN